MLILVLAYCKVKNCLIGLCKTRVAKWLIAYCATLVTEFVIGATGFQMGNSGRSAAMSIVRTLTVVTRFTRSRI